MRFYLDENVSDKVAAIARERGLDVVSSHECERDKLPDDEQLRLAAEDQRCLVTRDYRDFMPLTRRFLENRWPHAGVLIVPPSLSNGAFAAIVEALIAHAQGHPDGMPSYMVDYLIPRRN